MHTVSGCCVSWSSSQSLHRIMQCCNPRTSSTLLTRPQTISFTAAAAINQLELLDPSDAWLDTSHPLLADCAPSHAAAEGEEAGGPDGDEMGLLDEVSLADGMEEDGGDGDESGANDAAAAAAASIAAARASRRRRAAGAAAGGTAGVGGVVTLGALRREAALFAAAAALAGSLPGLQVLRSPALAADYVYDQTLAAGRLAAAETLAHALWRGGELEDRLERLAAAAAARCARAQGGERGEAPAGEADGMWDDGGASASASAAAGGRPGYLGSPAAAGWQQLRSLLARYDSAERRRLAGRLRVAAVDAALTESPGAALPAWLVAPFAPSSSSSGGMAGAPDDPAALLRVYVRHGRLDAAAELALEHLAAWQGLNPLARCKPAASWVPMRQLQVLDACLAEAAAAATAQQDGGFGAGGGGGGSGGSAAAARLSGLKARLRAAVGEHLALGLRDSQLAASGARGGGAVGMTFG
jgi:hypothetical protein